VCRKELARSLTKGIMGRICVIKDLFVTVLNRFKHRHGSLGVSYGYLLTASQLTNSSFQSYVFYSLFLICCPQAHVFVF
jgi:hypothetical protein